ncbi:MAG TPA: CoA-binding protein [Geobacteraceae bacterium]|nr:CoA-binding protein [Geobacteraceae bacterium]
MRSLDPLFYPKSVALIGASATEDKLGGIVLKNLLGLKGRIYPVNPNYGELMGLKAYPSITDVPETVDLSIIMRPAAEAPGILRQHAGKARFALVVSAGFAEIGASELQEELARIGREAGVRLVGPNCLGIYNPYHGLDTMFLPHSRLKKPGRGNMAIVSQSGAVMVCLLEAVRQANTGVSKVFNYGNAVDLDASDMFEYLAGDQDTRVVISYLESVGDGRGFIEAARKLADAKPLVVLKAGKGAGGQKAAFSHTGRLAGSYEVFRSVLRQFRIREAADYDVLLDAAKALSFQRSAPGKRVCVITNGGGSGVLAADECMRAGLDVPALPEPVADRLRAMFPPFYVLGNPIDLTGQVRTDDYRVALEGVRDAYDGFIIIALTGVAGVTLELAGIVRDFAAAAGKPVVVHIAQGGIAGKLSALMEKSKIPVYQSPERAVRAMGMLLGG